MKGTTLLAILVTLMLLAGCTLAPVLPFQPTTAPADAMPTSPAPATVEAPAATTPTTTTGVSPIATGTVSGTAAAPGASETPGPGTATATAGGPGVPGGTGTPGGTATAEVAFVTHRDPEAGFAIDYPAGWYLIVPPAEARRSAQAYTASIRSMSPDSPRPRGEGFPPGESGVDVTVWRTVAETLEAAVAERRQEMSSSETGTQIVSEESLTLAGRLPAVRWELETGQMGRVVEVMTLLNGNRVMVDGMGDLIYFDAIAGSLRPLGEGEGAGTAGGTATPASVGTPSAVGTPGAGTPAAGTPGAASTPAAAATSTQGQVYTDAGLGFSFSLPAGWELCQDSGWSRLFCRIETNPDIAEFPRFWVTVLPAGFTNEDFTAYNFIPEKHVRAFQSLPIGGTHTTDDTPGYSTFTRLSDTIVAGRRGVVVENAKVWEGGTDTKDRRVLVQVASSTFVFGTYYRTPEELAEFQEVLQGVQITAR